MRVFFVVNRIREVGFRQTTTLLIAAAYKLGFQVFIAEVDGLSLCPASEEKQGTDGASMCIFALSVDLKARVQPDCNLSTAEIAFSISESCQGVVPTDFRRVGVRFDDLVMIRTNPGRDLSRAVLHQSFLELCRVATHSGVQVINRPENLGFLASKAAVSLLPADFRPSMIVTRDPKMICEFASRSDADCVVKPLVGSRGKDVVRISMNAKDTIKLLNEKFEGQTVVVQEFVAADEPGDKRVVVVGGNVLEIEGRLAGIQRVAAAGDFRANLHAGGTAHPLKLTKGQREAAETAARILDDHGVQLAGVDLVGDKVIEFNVFSTGGLFDAMRFAELDFPMLIMQQLSGLGHQGSK